MRRKIRTESLVRIAVAIAFLALGAGCVFAPKLLYWWLRALS